MPLRPLLIGAFLLAMGLVVFKSMTATAVPVVGYVQQMPIYSPSLIGGGGFRVELHGAPRADMTPEETLAPLRAPGWTGAGKAKPMTGEPGPDAGTRLVLVFNGVVAPTKQLCNRPDKLGGEAQDGPLRVAAAYCVGGRMATSGGVSAGAISGPDDPLYKEAMTQLFLAMMPPRNNMLTNGGAR